MMGPRVLKKMGGPPSILLLNKIPQNWGSPGPLGPLGAYTPSCITNFKELNIKETLNATENQSKFVNKIVLFRVFSQMV